MFKSELKFLSQHKMMLMVLLMIALIPAIYCYLYLSSMWNTYGHTDDIPVAVVNHDRAVTFHGQHIAIGRQLTRSLENSSSLNFHHLSASTAHRQLKAGKLYLVVTIPRNFSNHATTLLTATPHQMTLHYDLNSGANYIVSKMTTGASTAITNQVSHNVTQLETHILLSALNGATTGMTRSANGSSQLVTGTQQLLNGNQKLLTATAPLKNPALTTGLSASYAGLMQVQNGSQTLSHALTSGSMRLATIATRPTTATALAAPVVAKTNDIASVPNNGTGMAPFAIAIGLYVGGIALGTMYDGRRTYSRPHSAFAWWGSKATIITGVAGVQSSLLYLTLHQANTLTTRSNLQLFAAILLGSLLFLSLIFCLRLLLGGFGTWLISIVLVMQLASSGGLYPLPLVSNFAKALNPWLPMTYLIQVLRSAISTNISLPGAWSIMILMTIGFNLLIVLRFHLDLKRNPLTH
ncbi:YhgE/Pip domain-containing protein [Levilactobacillus tujiorum]|uniref:ABC transporter permease n=1 Tax=Levilactobacillus tujiorum TaxID=2912243 RepID=A0ABX1L7N2_9LACO|nr:YhgE/Pip family protein [Levilactobacillus tujiorum]MCH5465321.1 YhgE/Pip family protein [Levilactobacillus tujiorum]NLR12523.1 ABC transporter permease [Lactobacillus sp. HBUAS51387]NLR30324.1 ABC transporter permease [Levilactobacillus tujiorum]